MNLLLSSSLAETPADQRVASTLSALASLLAYPDAGQDRLLLAAEQQLIGWPPPAAELFSTFAAALRRMSAGEREECYAATFDLSPACIPYVSIHLFGEENFKRGEFMAALAQRYQETRFTPSAELPDHLHNLLRYAAVAAPDERRELVEFCLLGPVERMLGQLSPDNPYRALLATIKAVLATACPGIQPAPCPLDAGSSPAAGCGMATATCHCGPSLASQTETVPADD